MSNIEILDIVAYENEVYTVTDMTSTSCTIYNNIKRLKVSKIHLTLIKKHHTQDLTDFLKCYIVVRDLAPIGMGINSAAHAGYCISKMTSPNIAIWDKKSFKKVTCIATEEQFEDCIKEIKKVGGREGVDYMIFVETDWKHGTDQRMSIAFAPRIAWPSVFKNLKLHSGKHLDGRIDK